MTKTRILVADDHGVVRKGLRFLLERQENLEVIGEAGDGREVVRMAEDLDPHIIVTDIAMPQLYHSLCVVKPRLRLFDLRVRGRLQRKVWAVPPSIEVVLVVAFQTRVLIERNHLFTNRLFLCGRPRLTQQGHAQTRASR